MSQSLGIAAIAEYLPSTVLGNPELVDRFGFEPEFLSQKIGIVERHIAGKEEAVSDMAVAAGEALFSSGVAAPNDIDLVVVCTQNPDYRLPATANLVQHRLGLRTDVAAFDINQGCSGFVYGLGAVQAFMAQHQHKQALLITAEAYSKVMNPNDRATAPLFGDGAAATLIRQNGAGRIGRFVFGSDGSGAADLIVRGGGSRAPTLPAEGEGALYMNGRAIYNFMMRRIPECIKDCLAANEVAIKDIDLFVFHQASRYMLDSLGAALELERRKLVIELDKIGNTVSSTIPMTLIRLERKGGLLGKRVVICGFGVGLSWAAAMLDYRKL